MPENIPARQARQAGYYQAKKAAGLVTIRDWVYPEDRAEIHELCEYLRETREGRIQLNCGCWVPLDHTGWCSTHGPPAA